MSAEERAGLFTCPTKCAATHPGREHEHDPRCYQRTGVPADLPADTCDCGVWGLFHPATPDAGDASEVEAWDYAIESGWLVQVVSKHTCGTGPDGYYGAHEPGCGTIPIADIATLLAAREAAARAEERIARGDS